MDKIHQTVNLDLHTSQSIITGYSLIWKDPTFPSEGIDIEYALRFGFQASNNEAEYEAVIAGLNLAHSPEIDQLEVCRTPSWYSKKNRKYLRGQKWKNDLIPQKGTGFTEKFVLV